MSKIFISYRRADTGGTCNHLHERLAKRFGDAAVFRDVDSIPGGTNYQELIRSEIEQSAVQLVLMGPQWLSVADQSGQRRLDDPNDIVRLEVEAALHHSVHVVPVSVDEASFPTQNQLPSSLKELANKSGLRLRNDASFEFDVGNIINTIAGWVGLPDEAINEPDTPSGAIKTRLLQLRFQYLRVKNVDIWKTHMCSLPAGSFRMGRNGGPKDEIPDHLVRLSAYEIGVHPVTVAEYACFVRAGHSQPASTGLPWEDQQRRRAIHPVTGVSWYDAVAYAAWLADLTGEGWRLPTEAEWEMAACWDWVKNLSHDYPWSNDFDPTRCNTDESDKRGTTPIDAYLNRGASPCGAQDMAGNVWEWTSSAYKDYPYDARDGRERPSSNELHIRRGGSWSSPPANARTTKRAADSPDHLDSSIGFRLVRGPSVGS
jgi:formylglycine-generating enzyme required for sulfatase activity